MKSAFAFIKALVLPFGAPVNSDHIAEGAADVMPPSLVAFYAAAFGGPFTIVGGTIYFQANGSYQYTVQLNSGDLASGAYDHVTNTVLEAVSSINNAPTGAETNYGGRSVSRVTFDDDGTLSVLGEMTIDFNSAPRGTVDWVTNVAAPNVVAPATGVLMAGNGRFYRNGRAFAATIDAVWRSTVAGSNALLAATRAGVVESGVTRTQPLQLAAAQNGQDYTFYFCNSSGADVFAAIDLSATPSAGTVTIVGNANLPSIWHIKDIGSTTQHTGLPTL